MSDPLTQDVAPPLSPPPHRPHSAPETPAKPTDTTPRTQMASAEEPIYCHDTHVTKGTTAPPEANHDLCSQGGDGHVALERPVATADAFVPNEDDCREDAVASLSGAPGSREGRRAREERKCVRRLSCDPDGSSPSAKRPTTEDYYQLNVTQVNRSYVTL
ncbi:uncharacterized protein LOC143502073 isoform X1 [Brachyhypopomus gauderio]|uniref:uncharacterized protein LOC143502073 isoform X1 n=2 Tax=Brachyhypopomus gauderio TaxID=698409 RepID=UPI00404173A4